MEKVTGIILSGGLAKRFQTNNKEWIDKATYIIEDKPILIRLIEILEKVTEDILIVVNNEKRKQSYLKLLDEFDKNSVKIYIDEKRNCKGPLLGILTGMKKAKERNCLILPCDLPYMKVETLRLLITSLYYNGITMYFHHNGEIEPVPSCIPIKNCLEVTELVCRLRKKRIDDIYRGFTELTLIPTYRMHEFDNQLESFINLNSPNDLKERKAFNGLKETMISSLPIRTDKKITDQVEVVHKILDNFEPNNLQPILNIISDLKNKKLYYWIATFYEFLAKYEPKYYNEAAENYSKESAFYSEKWIKFLARHAKSDQEWCLKQLEENR